mmetsp:Transcript_22159/g.71653  ORF Transcript_22159/g.71653 Transcript_22159/m.71653 type:complete len:139 (-) Transcript_22159:492-908(-)
MPVAVVVVGGSRRGEASNVGEGRQTPPAPTAPRRGDAEATEVVEADLSMRGRSKLPESCAATKPSSPPLVAPDLTAAAGTADALLAQAPLPQSPPLCGSSAKPEGAGRLRTGLTDESFTTRGLDASAMAVWARGALLG